MGRARQEIKNTMNVTRRNKPMMKHKTDGWSKHKKKTTISFGELATVIIGESSKAINAFIEMGLGHKLTLVLTKSTHFKCQQTDIYVCL